MMPSLVEYENLIYSLPTQFRTIKFSTLARFDFPSPQTYPARHQTPSLPAPNLRFEEPNLPELIREIEELLSKL